MKRVLPTFAAVLIVFITSFAATSFAQQADAPKPTTPKKPPAAQASEKPAESAGKRETPADREKEKEEHYDMAEVPPVVTHHQVTVEGKPLKYTATAGRLPIKRG